MLGESEIHRQEMRAAFIARFNLTLAGSHGKEPDEVGPGSVYSDLSSLEGFLWRREHMPSRSNLKASDTDVP